MRLSLCCFNWILLREDLDLEVSFNSWFLLICYGEA